jgi:hypothetical protein
MRPFELVHRMVLAALTARISGTADPVYEDIAWTGGWLGFVGHHATHRVAAEAVRTLGLKPAAHAARQFAWKTWYLWTANATLGYQADRLTAAWIERTILATGGLPESGCILVSVHHYNQRLAFAKLQSMVTELGAVSLFEGLAADDPELQKVDRVLSSQSRVRALSRFRDRVFGSLTFGPGVQIRQGLQLLDRGGALIVLADYSDAKRGQIFGRPFPVADGPLWFAERSAKPIVPFMLKKSGKYWTLWCGEQIEPTETALIAALEECIRQEPSAWRGWPAWYAPK